jgi:SNF2 family DNA or RNA helicase
MSKTSINLEQNGRYFPNWIMKNFKKYVLPEVIVKEGVDPCNEVREENKLNIYQEFIGQYLNYRSPFKDILLYHGVGAGKTISVINLYNVLYNYTPKWNVFLLMPASLHAQWLSEFKKWLAKENYEDRFNNIVIIHYNSPFADREFLEKVRKADSSKQSLFIIEEAHNFINNVYNNVSSGKGKRAQVIYDYIQQEKRENSDVRVMMLSATPLINNPFEFALLFNLLRPDIFPASENTFEQLYISSANYQALNENTKNMFQRRIIGLVSYYLGATPDKYATRIINYKKIPMASYQNETYDIFEEIEEKKEKLLKQMNRGKVGDQMSTYSAYTRQAANFVFPYISDTINGEGRPRPGKFRIKDEDMIVIDEGKDIEKIKQLTKSNKELADYNEAIKKYINGFISYTQDLYMNDKKNNHTILDDVKDWKNNYNSKNTEFLEKGIKSSLLKELYKCSPKFVICIFNILKSMGPVMVYSNYVNMEGLQIFKIYLGYFGFLDYYKDSEVNSDVSSSQGGKHDNYRYLEFHGAIDKDIRSQNKILFNKKENAHGKIVKIIMLSPAGAEGLTLHNTRQVHILEPYWNESRIEQIIGRAHRFCVHKDLPLNERRVDVFRYTMVRRSGKETADEKMERIARKKETLLVSFIDAVKEVAVDCELFKNHNMMGNKYKCFQFNQESYFEKPVGPAYNNNIEYDMKTDNGLNSNESLVKQIKTEKIRGVLLLDNDNYSEEKEYWFDNNTGIVYDYNNLYPIGKIIRNNDGYYPKLDNNIYIINEIIQIPEFRLYN